MDRGKSFTVEEKAKIDAFDFSLFALFYSIELFFKQNLVYNESEYISRIFSHFTRILQLIASL